MKDKPDIATILEHYGVRISHRHGWIACRCIIHDDRHASAAYNLDKQAYNCLVCNLLGDVYDLVARKEGLDFVGAKRKAESLANGNSRKILQRNNSTGSVLPIGTRHKRAGGGTIPTWKRN